MEISEILTKLRDTIAQNVAIKAFCQEKYQKDHTVYLFVNPDNMPSDEDYPIVVIYSVYRSKRGEGQRDRIYNALIGVGIKNETVSRPPGNAITYLGGIEVEELRELVEYAVFGGNLALKVNTVGETITEVEFPIFRSDTTIELWYRASTRGPIQKES